MRKSHLFVSALALVTGVGVATAAGARPPGGPVATPSAGSGCLPPPALPTARGWTADKVLAAGYGVTDSQLGDSASPERVYRSAAVSVSVDDTDKVEGCHSLDLKTRLGGGTSEVLVQRNGTPDLSFRPYGVAFSVKAVGPFPDTLQFSLVEDNDLDGHWEAGDGIWSTSVAVTGTDWRTVVVPYSSLRPRSDRDGRLSLHRIGLTEFSIKSSGGAAHPVQLKLDNYRQLVNDPGLASNRILAGTWIQFSPQAGGYNCTMCLDWSVARWRTELAKMKRLGMTQLFLQDSVFMPDPRKNSGGIALYQEPGSKLSWVSRRYATVDRLVQAATEVRGISLIFPTVYSPEGTESKCDAGRYDALLAKSRQVADELWRKYRRSPVFGGWYISQEVDDSSTPSCSTAAFLKATGAYYRGVSSHLKSKKKTLPVYIAPSTSSTLRLAEFSALWRSLLTQAPGISHIVMQDGIGQGRTTLRVDVPQYLGTMRQLATSLGRTFGVTVELFDDLAQQQSGRHEVGGIQRLTDQLAVEGRLTERLYGFHWFTTSSLYDEGPELLAAYSAYVDRSVAAQAKVSAAAKAKARSKSKAKSRSKVTSSRKAKTTKRR